MMNALNRLRQLHSVASSRPRRRQSGSSLATVARVETLEQRRLLSANTNATFPDSVFDVEVHSDITYGRSEVGFGTPGGVTLQDQQLDLYIPTGAGLPAILPAMIIVHGGGFSGGDKADFASLAQDFASRGYVTVSINYRLAGDNAPPAPVPPAVPDPDHDIVSAAVSDAFMAVRWMHDVAPQFSVDTSRIAIGGSSAGGFISNLVGALDQPDLVAAGYPASDFAPVAAVLDMSSSLNGFETALDADDPPWFIAHATNDTVVSHEQAVILDAALTAAGIPHEFPLIESGGHSWQAILNVEVDGVSVRDQIFSFFKTQLDLDALNVHPQTLFTAAQQDGQRELFTSDGTAAGTALLKNLAGNNSSDPQQLTKFGDKVVFTALTFNGQRELFISDGTAAGTVLLKNIGGTLSSDPRDLTVFDGRLFFTATMSNGQRELFVSDGTSAGTALFKNNSGTTSSDPTNLTVYDNRLFFTAARSNGQRELFVSDGTSAGTVFFKDLGGTNSSDPDSFTIFGDQLVFVATTNTGQRELFVSDGTSEGTVLLKNLGGTNSSDPAELTVFGDQLIFTAVTNTGQRELFVSDGTSAGTVLLKNMGGSLSSDPSQLTYMLKTDQLFFAATNSTGQRELFVTDGTAAGTVAFTNLSGSISSNPQNLTAWKTKLYFTATGSNGQTELYESDGTTAGTVLLKNLAGTASSDPGRLTIIGQRLFFGANMQNGQRELFVSDGTAAGTVFFKNLGGTVSSAPSSFTVLGPAAPGHSAATSNTVSFTPLTNDPTEDEEESELGEFFLL